MHCPFTNNASLEVSIGKIAVVTATTGEDIIGHSHSKAALRRRAGQWAINPNIPVLFMLQHPPTHTPNDKWLP